MIATMPPTELMGYDALTKQVQDALLERGVAVPPWRASALEREQFAFAVLRTIVEAQIPTPPGVALPELAADIAGRLAGLGVLDPFLRRDGIEEIIVRRGLTQIERGGVVETVGTLASDDYFLDLAQRVAEMAGKPLRAANPFVLVDLPGGSRFTAMIPPLSHNGTAINIRVFSREVFALDALVAKNALAPWMADALRHAFHTERATLLISGRPGSGKTTLANALLAEVSSTLQLCIAETFEEIRVAHPATARAVVREEVEAGRVTMADVVNVLYTRMRPDLLVVGEVVSVEARQFLQAINLGVQALTTIHGASARDALTRLETLAQEEGVPLSATRERIARGIRYVIHMDKDANGARRIVEIARVLGLRDGAYALQMLEEPSRSDTSGASTPANVRTF